MNSFLTPAPALLDAVAFPPPERPAALIARFHDLPPGGRMVLQLDQDPRALLGLLQSENPGRFEWSPLEEGPACWRVEIVRRDVPPGAQRQVTEALSWDHDRLDALGTHAFELRGAGDFAAAANLWREFQHGLRRHIGFEEILLFPRFEEKTGIPPTMGPTAVMREEHTRIKALLGAITQCMGDPDLPVDGLRSALLEVLGEHNAKEEQMLYPAIEQFLNDAENDALVREIQAFSA